MPQYMDVNDVMQHFGGKIKRTTAYRLMHKVGVVTGLGKVLVEAEKFLAYLAPKPPVVLPRKHRPPLAGTPTHFKYFP